MDLSNFPRMEDPSAAFYLLALADALSAMMSGVYSTKVPQEVQHYAFLLSKYFRDQLPEDGFMVTPTDWIG